MVSKDVYNILGVICPYCESGNMDVKYGQGKHTRICGTCGAEFRIVLMFMVAQMEESAIGKALDGLPLYVFYEWDRRTDEEDKAEEETAEKETTEKRKRESPKGQVVSVR